MAKIHGGTHHVQGQLHRGGTKPEATTTPGFHAGSGRPKGVLHEAPTKPMINAANYAAQKIRRK
jgi:hypothetical protein